MSLKLTNFLALQSFEFAKAFHKLQTTVQAPFMSQEERSTTDIQSRADQLLEQGLFLDYFNMTKNGYAPLKHQQGRLDVFVDEAIANGNWSALTELIDSGYKLSVEKFSDFFVAYVNNAVHFQQADASKLLNFLATNTTEGATPFNDYLKTTLSEPAYQQQLCKDLVSQLFKPHEKISLTSKLYEQPELAVALYNDQLSQHQPLLSNIVQHMDSKTQREVIGLAIKRLEAQDFQGVASITHICHAIMEDMPQSLRQQVALASTIALDKSKDDKAVKHSDIIGLHLPRTTLHDLQQVEQTLEKLFNKEAQLYADEFFAICRIQNEQLPMMAKQFMTLKNKELASHAIPLGDYRASKAEQFIAAKLDNICKDIYPIEEKLNLLQEQKQQSAQEFMRKYRRM